jgi:hypothetical protein
MAIDFSGRILVIHPTALFLGRSVLFLGLIVIAIGIVTCFTGDFLVPAPAWLVSAIPTVTIGAILVGCSVTKP